MITYPFAKQLFLVLSPWRINRPPNSSMIFCHTNPVFLDLFSVMSWVTLETSRALRNGWGHDPFIGGEYLRELPSSIIAPSTWKERKTKLHQSGLQAKDDLSIHNIIALNSKPQLVDTTKKYGYFWSDILLTGLNVITHWWFISFSSVPREEEMPSIFWH